MEQIDRATHGRRLDVQAVRVIYTTMVSWSFPRRQRTAPSGVGLSGPPLAQVPGPPSAARGSSLGHFTSPPTT